MEFRELLNVNMNEAINSLTEDLGLVAIDVVIFTLLVVAGYIAGRIVGRIIKEFLRSKVPRDIFMKYGAMTSNSWKDITEFLGKYVKWLAVIFLLATYYHESEELASLLELATNILAFILLLLVGWIISGVLYKFIRGTIVTIGLEKTLKNYGVDTVGGINISHATATLIKVYVFLLFAWEGVRQLGLEIFSEFMRGLMSYIPEVILGLAMIIFALMVADFTGTRIKKSKVQFAASLAVVAQVVITLVGVTIALPKFGIEDVEIIKYSFLIIVLCMGLGFAIAMGLGLKDSFAKIGGRYTKKL